MTGTGDGAVPLAFPSEVPAATHLFAGGLTDLLRVDGEDGHHLIRVLRLTPGQLVTVADGAGEWRVYALEGGSEGTARLVAESALHREPAFDPRLAVAFALTKGDGPDLAVRQLTEMGVQRILPVTSARAVPRWDPGRRQASLTRWRRIALEAARQCRRAHLPEVAPLGKLADLSGHPGLVVAKRGGVVPGLVGPPVGGEILAVVGPEGGLSEAEVTALTPWATVDLGPYVLRAATAVVVAAAVLGATRSAVDRQIAGFKAIAAPVSPVVGAGA
ncbi:MAG: RsmE family RNA methyltransferase [Acidimicrobiia bacterium]